MLRAMRKNAASLWIKLVFGVIVLVFVFWGVGVGVSGRKIDAAAWVNDRPITTLSLQRAESNLKDAYRELYKEGLTPEFLEALDLRSQALEQLIQLSLLRQEAERIGFVVGDQELREAIATLPAFQNEAGRFDPRRYRVLLRGRNLPPADFEESYREELLAQKVRSLVTTGVYVSEAELRERFRFENEKVALRFVRVPAREMLDRVSWDEEELAEFYEREKERFREPEKVRVELAVFADRRLAESVSVNEAEAREAYTREYPDGNPPFEEVREELLRKIREQRAPEYRRRLATDIRGRAAAGKPLEELAREAGGEFLVLGPFSRIDRPSEVAVDGFVDRAFATPEGGVGEVLHGEKASYVYRVLEKRPSEIPPFEEVRGEVEKLLREEKARKLAREEAEKILQKALETGDLAAAAREAGREVAETGFFRREDALVPGLGLAPEVRAVAFRLDANRPVAPAVYEVEGDAVVVAWKEKKVPGEEEFESAKEELRSRLETQRKNLVLQEFFDLLKRKAEIRVRPEVLGTAAGAR
ncbi:MAG: peptidylprolyl isomerase [Candidatus Binatia bacterium]|nr:MAG: peptidylprolyl isomerase [Candidatus Binatia bacterium]